MKFIIEFDLEHDQHHNMYGLLTSLTSMVNSLKDTGLNPGVDLRCALHEHPMEDYLMLCEAAPPELPPEDNCTARILLSRSDFNKKFYSREQVARTGQEMETRKARNGTIIKGEQV